MDKWTRQDINNSKFRELCENFIIIKEKWDTVRQQSKNMMRVCLFAYLMIKSN